MRAGRLLGQVSGRSQDQLAETVQAEDKLETFVREALESSVVIVTHTVGEGNPQSLWVRSGETNARQKSLHLRHRDYPR